jgi:hypothetical protein
MDPLRHLFLHPMAYLDPGTGSYLLQLLLAGLLGAIFIVRAFWGRIKSFFTKKTAEDEEEDVDAEG